VPPYKLNDLFLAIACKQDQPHDPESDITTLSVSQLEWPVSLLNHCAKSSDAIQTTELIEHLTDKQRDIEMLVRKKCVL
jgi:hypothetical protein